MIEGMLRTTRVVVTDLVPMLAMLSVRRVWPQPSTTTTEGLARVQRRMRRALRRLGIELETLGAERIPIIAQDLFGVQPRKVCFFVRSGRTLVKRLPAAGEIARVERAYRSQLAQKPVAGSVELF